MINCIYRVEYRHSGLSMHSLDKDFLVKIGHLTGTLMIHPVAPPVPLIQMTQKSKPTAPINSHIRKTSCAILLHLTLSFVRGLIGFQFKLP